MQRRDRTQGHMELFSLVEFVIKNCKKKKKFRDVSGSRKK